MQFILFHRRFSISILLASLVIVTALFMVKLGFWQLDRAEQKLALQESVSLAAKAPLESLHVLPKDFSEQAVEWQYRKVEFFGQYRSDKQLLLDNQFSGESQDKRAGFDVITPFELSDGSLLLVNRGWLPRKQSKAELPNIAFVPEKQSVKGIIRLPSKAFALGEMTNNERRWPQLIQFIDIEKIAELLNEEVQPVVLMLLPEEENDYLRTWQNKHDIKMGPAVHYGYAFQWFALTATLIVLSLGLLITKSKKA